MRPIMAVLSLTLLIWAEPARAQTTIKASVSVHRGVDPLTAQQVKTILANASQAVQTNPGFACSVRFKLSGKVGKFGSRKSPNTGPTPQVIETEQQRDAVHRVGSLRDAHFRIKVVAGIGSCIPNESSLFNGCAWPPRYRSIIVVHPRLHLVPNYPDHILWAHEYGHLTGLSHRTSQDGNALMTGCSVLPTSVEMTKKECTCLRAGPGACGRPTPRRCPSS